MKRTLMFLSFVVTLAVMTIPAGAGSAIVLQGEVPFDFYVENQMLPAGEYIFEMGRVGDATTDSVTVVATSSITVRAKDGKVVTLVSTRPGTRRDMTPSQLVFNTYEGNFHLASVECPGYKADLRSSKSTHQVEVVQFALILPKR